MRRSPLLSNEKRGGSLIGIYSRDCGLSLNLRWCTLWLFHMHWVIAHSLPMLGDFELVREAAREKRGVAHGTRTFWPNRNPPSWFRRHLAALPVAVFAS